MKYIYLILTGFLISNAVYADVQYGISPSLTFFKVKDPVADSRSAFELQPLNFSIVYSLGRNTRIWTELSQIKFESKAGIDQPSQDVQALVFGVAYQKRFKFSPNFKPWLSAGVYSSQSEYGERFTIDEDGFLAETFPERDETETNLKFSFILEYKLSKSYDLNLGFSYQDSLNDGLSGFSLDFGFLYR